MPRLKAKTVDVLFAFDEVNARLAAAVQPEMFALYAAPAINLFEKTTDRIPLKSSQHEYHVVPDRSHYLDYEPHRLLEVYAHHPGGRDRGPVQPLYSASLEGSQHAYGLYFTVRRLPRRRTVEEKRVGMASDYTGTDMFISLSALGGDDDDAAVAELSVRALCSNRHLTEHLPIGIGGADFRLIDDITLDLVCVAGPTPPREPVVTQLRSRSEVAHTGTVAWRLVNMLSTNHLGLVERGAGRNALALRETLSMFAEMTDAATARRAPCPPRGVRVGPLSLSSGRPKAGPVGFAHPTINRRGGFDLPAQSRGRALAVRLFHGVAPSRARLQGLATHQRQRSAPGGVR